MYPCSEQYLNNFIELFNTELSKNSHWEGLYNALYRIRFYLDHQSFGNMVLPFLKRYKELYDLYVQSENFKHLNLIVDEFEYFDPGFGYLLLGKTYAERGCYVDAFEQYAMILADQNNIISEARKIEASLEIANMIFTGYVTLNNQGKVDEKLSEQWHVLSDQEKSVSNADPTIIRQRVIFAYEYVCCFPFPDSASLRHRFNHILSGTFTVSTEQTEPIWTVDSIEKYVDYYRVKNPKLLSEKSFLDSIKTLCQENKKLKNKNSPLPFFVENNDKASNVKQNIKKL